MTSPQPTDADLAEVQGLVLTGYGANCMRTRVLTVIDPAQGREFIGSLLRAGLLDFGGTHDGRKPTSMVNIGFTYEGLRALGVPQAILATLEEKSPAYAAGAPVRAARYLGDAGESAVDRWNSVFHLKQAHLWISIHGDTPRSVQDAAAKLQALHGAAAGLAQWEHADAVPDAQNFSLEAQNPRARYVHFGLRDNLTKPSIFGKHPKSGHGGTSRPDPPQAAGELLIGYANNDGADLWTARAARDPSVFLRNGSFGILRQVRQFDARLAAYLERQAAAWSQAGYPFVTTEYLKAKMCGRWPNGSPVTPHANVQPRQAHLGKPDFSQDPDGFGCPFGAHIRRGNPRTDPMMPPRLRPLFRRGMPYGKNFASGDTDDHDRGLVGVFFCGRIEDQFELLIAEWLEKNPLGPFNTGRAKDPLVGRHDEPDAEFHIPLPGRPPIVLSGFAPFVRTRGTLYALFPSRRALQEIARGEHGSRS